MTTEKESGELNIRGMNPQLVERVKIAALRRGGRAALRVWVSQALAEALRNEASAPWPRLKLCARCVRSNEDLAKRSNTQERLAGSGSPASSHADTRLPGPGGCASSPFADLIGKIEGKSDEPGAAPDTTSKQAPIEAAANSMAGAEPARLQPPSLPKPGIEIAPGLWIGSDADYERWRQAYIALPYPPAWSVLQAAKEPWHRSMVGYQTKSAPECPERLIARQGNRMALNLIDVRKLGPGGTTYVPAEVISAALHFIDDRLAAGDQVLVHAGSGKSRSPALGFLYLQRHGLLPYQFQAAMELFRAKYPGFEPGAGMLSVLEQQTAPATDVCAKKGEPLASQARTDGHLQLVRA